MGESLGRLLDAIDSVRHRAIAFEECVRENASSFRTRLMRYEQLKSAVDETGKALLQFGREQARDWDRRGPVGGKQ